LVSASVCHEDASPQSITLFVPPVIPRSDPSLCSHQAKVVGRPDLSDWQVFPCKMDSRKLSTMRCRFFVSMYQIATPQSTATDMSCQRRRHLASSEGKKRSAATCTRLACANSLSMSSEIEIFSISILVVIEQPLDSPPQPQSFFAIILLLRERFCLEPTGHMEADRL